MDEERKAPEERTLINNDYCFVCGRNNPIGLHTTWSFEDGGIARSRFEPHSHHQGWQGVLHGGILATLLDEAMAQRLRFSDIFAVTATISVRYRRPAPTAGVLIVEGMLVSEKSRTIQCRARVRGEDGLLYAEAEGTCVRMRRP